MIANVTPFMAMRTRNLKSTGTILLLPRKLDNPSHNVFRALLDLPMSPPNSALRHFAEKRNKNLHGRHDFGSI